MKGRKFKISIYDESHLADVGSVSATRITLYLAAALIALFLIFIGIAIVWFSPLKHNLPGYLKADQRSATEENMMKLDSLTNAYKVNQIYIDNLLTVLNTDRMPQDSSVFISKTGVQNITLDSLLASSDAEKDFVRDIQERDKYNFSKISLLEAEGIRFYPVNIEGVFTENSQKEKQGKIALPKHGTVNAISDGRVINIESPFTDSRYSIVIQHENGFLSKLSGIGKPFVSEGDKVFGGQPVAMSPNDKPLNPKIITVQLWHNGTPLVPFEYIGSEPFNIDNLPL